MDPKDKLKLIGVSVIGVVLYLITRLMPGGQWDQQTWTNRKMYNTVENIN